MDGWLLEDYITISGKPGAGVYSIAQSSHKYMDVGDYEDLVFYLDVRNYSGGGGTLSVAYETSPTREDSTFLAMMAPVALSQPGLVVTAAPFAIASTPAARFVRWRLFAPLATGAWEATFRILVTAYSYA